MSMSFFSRKGRRTPPVVVASSSSMTNKREVWEVSKPGSLSALELRKDVPLTALEDEDKVRVEVKYIGLNFADVFTVLGLYGATPKNETFIPGLEFSGVCVEEGKGGKEDKGTDAKEAFDEFKCCNRGRGKKKNPD